MISSKCQTNSSFCPRVIYPRSTCRAHHYTATYTNADDLSKNLKYYEGKEELTAASLTLSVESSPFVIPGISNFSNRSTSPFYKKSHITKSQYDSRSRKLGTNREMRISRLKSEECQSCSKKCGCDSECKYNSGSKYHRSNSKYPKHEAIRCKCNNGCRLHTSSTSFRRHKSRKPRSKSISFKTGPELHTNKHHRCCSKHYRTGFFSRSSKSSVGSSVSLCSRRKSHKVCRSTGSQFPSRTYQSYRMLSNESVCGCTEYTPHENVEFCEGCNIARQFNTLVPTYSEPSFSCRSNFCINCDLCMNEVALHYAALNYPKTSNQYAVQLLSGHCSDSSLTTGVDDKDVGYEGDCEYEVA